MKTLYALRYETVWGRLNVETLLTQFVAWLPKLLSAIGIVMAGFLILWDKPFHSGDWVTLGDRYGKVEEITMRTTRLLTWNNTQIIIPNETVINQVLVNHSSYGRIRVEVPIEISAKENVSEIRKAIVNALRKVEGVMQEPPPSVVIKSMGSATVDLLICAWVADAERERPIQFKILEVSRPLYQDSQRGVPMAS